MHMRIGCGGNEVYPKWLGRHATNGLDLLAFQAGRFENHAEESVIAALMTAVTSSDRATPPIPAKTDGGADIQVGRRLLFAELLARPVTFKFIAWAWPPMYGIPIQLHVGADFGCSVPAIRWRPTLKVGDIPSAGTTQDNAGASVGSSA